MKILDESRIVEYIRSNFHKSLMNRMQRQEEWVSYYNHYRSKPEAKPYEWMHNTFIPLTTSKVNAMTAMLMSILYSVNPPIAVKTRKSDMPEYEAEAELMNKLLNYRFDMSESYNKTNNAIRSLCVFGTVFLKCWWDYSVEKRYRRENPFDALGNKRGYKKTKQDVVTFDGPNFEVADIFSIFLPTNATDTHWEWIIHRTKRTYNYLLEMQNQGIYKNVEACKGMTAPTDANVELDPNKPTRDDSVSELTREHEVLEFWGNFDLDDDGIEESVVMTLIDRQILVRAEENPYWYSGSPFIRVPYINIPGEPYGIGIPELMYDLQLEVNDLRNQRVDNVSLILNRMWQYRKSSGLKPEQLVSKPGAHIPVQEIGKDIAPLDTPDVTTSAYRETSDIERWIQEATMVTKLTLGIGGQFSKDMNQTARGMQILQQMTGEYMVALAKNIENTMLKPLIKRYYQLEYQYDDVDTIRKIVGNDAVDWIPRAPEDIEKDYSLIPVGVFGMENKMERTQKLINFLQVSMQMPEINRAKIMGKIWTSMGFENPEEIIASQEQMAQNMMAQGGAQMPGAEGMTPAGQAPEEMEGAYPGNLLQGIQ